MAWEVNDVISIQLNQTLYGREMLNKLFYRIVAKTTSVIVEEVLAELCEFLVSYLRSVQTSNLTHTDQVVLNESNGIDIFISSFSSTGVLVSGEDAPGFVSMGFVKNVPSRLTKKGSIRIAGQKEDVWVSEVLNPSYQTIVNNLQAVLGSSQVVQDSNTLTMEFEPVVVGRLATGGLDLTRVLPITSVSGVKVTTQNTRKG